MRGSRGTRSVGSTFRRNTLIGVAAVVVLLVVVDVVLVAMAMARTAPGSFGTPGPDGAPIPTGGK